MFECHESHRPKSRDLTERMGLQIINCELFSEDGYLTEMDLASTFGVSRGAIREAVKILSSKDMIVSRQRLGIRKLPQDQWNMYDCELFSWLVAQDPHGDSHKGFCMAKEMCEVEAVERLAFIDDAQLAGEFFYFISASESTQLSMGDKIEAKIRVHQNLLKASGNIFYHQIAKLLTVSYRSPAFDAVRIFGDSQYADLNNQLLVCLRGKKMRQAKGVLRRLLRLEYQLMFEEATTAYNSFVV